MDNGSGLSLKTFWVQIIGGRLEKSVCEKFHVFGEKFECMFTGVEEQLTFIFVAFCEQEENEM